MGTDNDSEKGLATWHIVLFAVCGLFVLVGLFRCACDSSEQRATVARGTHALIGRARELGAYLGTRIPDARVLLLTRPRKSGLYSEDIVDFAYDGLKAGLRVSGGDVEEFDGPQFDEHAARKLLKDGEEMPDLDRWQPRLGVWLDRRTFVEAVKRYPECNLVVSLIGLPVSTEKELRQLSTDLGGKKVAVLAGPLPEPDLVEKAFARDVLVAAVVPGTCKFDGEMAPVQGVGSGGEEFSILKKETARKVADQCPEIIQQATWVRE
jgi:hypothetical protein